MRCKMLYCTFCHSFKGKCMHNGLQMIKGWWTRLCACARICTRSSTKEQERLNNVHKGHIQIKVSQFTRLLNMHKGHCSQYTKCLLNECNATVTEAIYQTGQTKEVKRCYAMQYAMLCTARSASSRRLWSRWAARSVSSRDFLGVDGPPDR